jgi:hypothetical protein
MAHKLRLRRIQKKFAICKLLPEDSFPPWATSGEIWSVTRTPTELSVVCVQSNLPPGFGAERDWRALQVIGPLPFEMVGVLSSVAAPLADAGVSIFVISTAEADLIFVREQSFETACQILVEAGHMVLEA